MTKEQHPVTLHLRLVNQWLEEWNQEPEGTPLFYVARRAIQWGADVELEACCEWVAEKLPHLPTIDKRLRNDRRPKSKLQSPTLEEVDDLCAEHNFHYDDSETLKVLQLLITDAIARWGYQALEALPDD
jgi:hypothetical protein